MAGQSGNPGMKDSGKTISFAPASAAFKICAQVFLTVAWVFK
jgi:hypothetical protein